MKREGDGATPLGEFPVRRVFYRSDRWPRPHMDVPVRPIGPRDGWCDASTSPSYNRLIHLPFSESHEVMLRQDHLYDVVLELGYNDDPPLPGRGSAIFLHLARDDFGPTEGCVAVRPITMRVILAALRPVSTVAIGRTAAG